MSITRKIWGIKQRLIENNNTEVDLLYLEKDSVCSLHCHEKKINRFILLSGKVRIDTSLGPKSLIVNEAFDVEPPLVHKFSVLEDSVMIEIAYTTSEKIDNDDIQRFVQGGKIIEGGFVPHNEICMFGEIKNV